VLFRNLRLDMMLIVANLQNNKYVAVCETLRLDKDDDMPAQISIYNLLTMARHKTLSLVCEADFVQTCFCGDMKYLASLTGEAARQVRSMQNATVT
jgi:hypothetical protein